MVCFGWAMSRSAALEQLGGDRRLVLWIRYVVPALIVAVWIWWALTELFGVVAAV